VNDILENDIREELDIIKMTFPTVSTAYLGFAGDYPNTCWLHIPRKMLGDIDKNKLEVQLWW